MKRTGEIILSVIGIISYGFLAGLGGTMLALQNNDEFLQEIMAQESGLNDLDTIIEGLSTGAWVLIIVALLSIILGIIAIFLIKGNKRPKSGGAIYIALSVIGSFITVGFAVIPGIFYLIAGIMCFVRKPVQPLEY